MMQYRQHNRATCIVPNCPLCARATSIFRVQEQLAGIDNELSSDSVTVFVGSHNYPNLNVGILTPPQGGDDSYMYDAPREWAGKGFKQSQVVGLRSMLINSRFKTSAFSARSPKRFLQAAQELALSSRPVDVDISLIQQPKVEMNYNPYFAPIGHSAGLVNVNVIENPHVPTIVEKIVSDTDLKATGAIGELQKRFDENYITRLLSVGNLGLGKNRRLVPTRSSITAVDDILGKKILDGLRDCPESNYLAYFGGFFGNYYLILFFAEKWGYELFEITTTGLNYSTDYEAYEGRHDYAANCVGGYYAARLAIVQKLAEMKRQASVLCLRFITPEYTQPLGVWVVREAVRKTLQSQPIEFSGKDLLLKYAELKSSRFLSTDIGFILAKSRLLASIKSQTKLSSFI